MNLLYAIQLLQSLLTLLPQGQALYAEYQAQVAALQAMIDDGNREPTQAEWDALNALIEQQRAILHAE